MERRFISIDYNLENVLRYKSKDNLLRHARTGKGISGVMYIDQESNELIGYIGWEGNMIIALEVTKNYRGQGYGRLLMGEALKNGCDSLTVSENNHVAQNLYGSLGFRKVSGRLWKLEKSIMKTWKE